MNKLGISFNPEHPNLSQYSTSEKLEMLRFCIEDLNIKDIRLSIRWSDVGEEIDLTIYKPYWDLAVSNTVNITLNIGPIKTMRWPEETIPDNLVPAPKRGELVYPDSEIGKLASGYLESLLTKLSKEHSEFFNSLYGVQLDNEPFNIFGQYGYKMTPEWILNTLEILNKYSPNARVLFNSNARQDLRMIVKTLILAKELFPKMKWIIGINYYWHIPHMYKTPILRNMDNLTLSYIWSMRLKTLRSFAKENNIELEISEFQGEPWGSEIPGNDAERFRHQLKVGSKKVFGKKDLPSVASAKEEGLIRYWGIEYLLDLKAQDRLTEEQEGILEIIQRINFGS